jgi:hypothetical protein
VPPEERALSLRSEDMFCAAFAFWSEVAVLGLQLAWSEQAARPVVGIGAGWGVAVQRCSGGTQQTGGGPRTTVCTTWWACDSLPLAAIASGALLPDIGAGRAGGEGASAVDWSRGGRDGRASWGPLPLYS